jgi:hypothetical protein
VRINHPPTSSDPVETASTAESRDVPAAPRDYWRDIGMHLGVAERDRAGEQLAASDE